MPTKAVPKTALAGAIAAGLLIPTAAADLPQEWDIQLQCRSSLDPNIPPFNLPFPSSLSSQEVALDDDGGVAIRAVLAGDATEGIFYGQDGAGGLVHSVNDGASVYSQHVDLRAGMIGLTFLEFGGGAEVRDTSGGLVEEFPAGGPEAVSDPSSLAVTTDGALGYRGKFGGFQKYVIDEFVEGERVQTLVASNLDPAIDFLFNPDTNDARQMVGVRLLSDGNEEIIRYEPGGDETLIAESADGFNAFVNSSAIAENGDVAYTARRTGDSIWQVTRSDADAGTIIAEGGDLDIENGSLANFPPDINSNGWVAFRATRGPTTALFVGDGDDLVEVVGFGDVVETDIGPLALGFDFGEPTGIQLVNGPVDVNDQNQIAFAAFLENGTIGVFVATPVAGCPADFNDDGRLSVLDFIAFQNAFTAGDETADCNQDGELSVLDFVCFQNLFQAGCA